MQYKEISNKFLLIDANVLINYTKFQELYQDFFDQLAKDGIKIIIDDLVKFEILRFAKNHTEKNKIVSFFDKFLESFESMKMPLLDEQTCLDATKVANLYQAKLPSSKNISLTDCFLAAYMYKYNKDGKRLYLATENHKDFPKVLFNRIGIETIDTKGDDNSSIHNIGIYELNIQATDLIDKM